MTGIVIQYNRRSGTRKIETFDGETGIADAARRRMYLERNRANSDMEIVSLVADSVDEIEQTHSRYFARG